MSKCSSNTPVASLRVEPSLAGYRRLFRRLAEALSIDATGERIEQFAAAATFSRMKEPAEELAPEVGNQIWRSNREFFHRGCDGQWRELLDGEGLRRYEHRVAELVPPDVAAWAHTGWLTQRPAQQ